jgi:hypothetical protein
MKRDALEDRFGGGRIITIGGRELSFGYANWIEW